MPQSKGELARAERARQRAARRAGRGAGAAGSRIDVRARHDGVAVFGDPDDWLGRPVITGERIMLLANPDKPGMLIHLPVADAIALDVGAPVKLFLTVKPLSPLDARITETSYQAVLSPEGVASYRLRASVDDDKDASASACVARPSSMATGWCWATICCAARWPRCASGAAGEWYTAATICTVCHRCVKTCACMKPRRERMVLRPGRFRTR